MAPPVSKANYKTYEAQARMVRAIVAAHSDVKWNYKEIAACYGSDMTEHALNHRFRRLRAQSAIVRQARQQGLDMKDMANPDDLPTTQEKIDKNNISKYFGQSTADGIQFQFRSIKRDAEFLRQVEADGGDVANCLSNIGASLSSGSAMSTPVGKTKAAPSRGSRSGTGTGRKRGRAGAVHTLGQLKRSSSDDDDDGDDYNWSECDETPSKRPRAGLAAGQKTVTPRRAAQKANVTIADAAAQLQDSMSPTPIGTPTGSGGRRTPLPVGRKAPLQSSLFGPFDQTPAVGRANSYMTTVMDSRSPFAEGGSFPGEMEMDDGYGDGEI